MFSVIILIESIRIIIEKIAHVKCPAQFACVRIFGAEILKYICPVRAALETNYTGKFFEFVYDCSPTPINLASHRVKRQNLENPKTGIKILYPNCNCTLPWPVPGRGYSMSSTGHDGDGESLKLLNFKVWEFTHYKIFLRRLTPSSISPTP